jgi:hypothetical protein
MKSFRKYVAIAVDGGGIKGRSESLRPLSSSLRPLKEMSQRHQRPSVGSAIHCCHTQGGMSKGGKRNDRNHHF